MLAGFCHKLTGNFELCKNSIEKYFQAMWVPCVYHVWPNWIPDGERSKVINFSGAGKVNKICLHEHSTQKWYSVFVHTWGLRYGFRNSLCSSQCSSKRSEVSPVNVMVTMTMTELLGVDGPSLVPNT